MLKFGYIFWRSGKTIMKKILSISLGSSRRDGEATAEFGGQKFHIERIGTDGSIKKAAAILKELDGMRDVFSLGGTNMYVYVKNKRYGFQESLKIAQAAKKTPVVDGSGVKNTLERRIIPYLEKEHKIFFKNKKVLLVSALDRFGLAEALVTSEAEVIFGDLMFGLGIPVPIKNFNNFTFLAKTAMPLIAKLPVGMFYPTGEKQNETKPKFKKYFDKAQIIAGDFHFIKKNMPENLSGKIIITNTVTKEDEKLLKNSGVATLVTTTPEIGGRSFGANVLEGVLVAYAGQGRNSLSTAEYDALLEKINIKPRVVF
jgi:hypothetical protein